MQKILTLILSFSALSIISLSAQEGPWTLEDCINYAMENNISIKQTELNTHYNENLLNQAKQSRFPNLNARSNYNYSFGRSLDQTSYEFKTEDQHYVGINLSSSVTLFNGFQIKNTIEQNNLNLLGSYRDVEKIKNDISLNIAASYLQILFSQELLQAAKNQLEITKQQVDRTQKMVNAGKLAKGSALEIQAQYASEELNVVNAENQLQLAYLNLQQILDLQYHPSFEIEIPVIETPDASSLVMNVNDVYSSAEEIMPQIGSAQYALEASNKQLEIAKGAIYPSLVMTANTRSDYSSLAQNPASPFQKYDFASQMNDNISAGIGLTLNIPIYNRGQVKTSIANAHIGIENSRLDLQNKKNALYRDIQQSYTDALAALKKYQASEKALVSMEESFKYTEKKFEVGLVNTVDYNASKNQLMITQSDLLQSKYDFIFKTKILNFYKGEPITL